VTDRESLLATVLDNLANATARLVEQVRGVAAGWWPAPG
jgi:hypothetical protein